MAVSDPKRINVSQKNLNLTTHWKISERSEWEEGCQESQGMQTYLNSVWGDPGSNRENTQKKRRKHRLNMEKDLKSLFRLHVHSCTHLLRPRNSPPPCIWAHIRGCYCSAKIDDISLWPRGERKRDGGQVDIYLLVRYGLGLMSDGPGQEGMAHTELWNCGKHGLTEYHVFSFAEKCVV